MFVIVHDLRIQAIQIDINVTIANGGTNENELVELKEIK